jgi:AcrR family transcriptional regulator
MVDKLARRPSQKQHLFEQAIELVAHKGVDGLTIENLAVAAGMTKGGVQYHFHTKDQLVTELLAGLLQQVDEAIAFEAGADAHGAAWLCAYINITLRAPSAADGVAISLLAAMPPDDPRAEPFRLASARWRERAERGVKDKALAQIIRMAADSAWIELIYGDLKTADLRTLRHRLFELVETLA